MRVFLYASFYILIFVLFLTHACRKQVPSISYDNPLVYLPIPAGFPAWNLSVKDNMPTKYGVELGEKLFHEKRLSGNNSISCASCHQRAKAFTDGQRQAVGIYERVGLRNTPAIQNLAFLQLYNWDGHILRLENQPLVPIITHEEMNSSILEVIGKLKDDPMYRRLFAQAFGQAQITADGIYKSLAQYQYTLISANSKYDRMRLGKEEFSEAEQRGLRVFNQKCANCHATALFTDQSFRNIGFPVNTNTNEAGRARVTGIAADYMRFRVPSLRNVSLTAPYGSFGQFASLREVLDYLDRGVLDSDNLDPILKSNGNKIPLSEKEKEDVIQFLNTLRDEQFR